MASHVQCSTVLYCTSRSFHVYRSPIQFLSSPPESFPSLDLPLSFLFLLSSPLLFSSYSFLNPSFLSSISHHSHRHSHNFQVRTASPTQLVDACTPDSGSAPISPKIPVLQTSIQNPANPIGRKIEF